MRNVQSSYDVAYADASRLEEVLRLAAMSQSWTGTTLAQVKIAMASAWRSMVRLRYDEALGMAHQIELALGDLPKTSAVAIRDQVAILRAVGLSFQDDKPAALRIAVSALKRGGEFSNSRIALTICRLAYWKLGDLDNFHALQRDRALSSVGRISAMCTVYDLTIDAAMALEQLRLKAAQRLALEALDKARTIPGRDSAIEAFPASLLAQILYEEGALAPAEATLLPIVHGVRMRGTIESALRVYPLLAKIAASRQEIDQAVTILKEAEALGETRGWPRLAAASLMEQVYLFTENGAWRAATSCSERLDLLTGRGRAGSASTRAPLSRYGILARSRIALLQGPGRDDVAHLRQLHYEAAHWHDLYAAVQTAVQLASTLLAIGEKHEALTIFLRIVKLGWAVGLCQTLIDGGPKMGELLDLVAELLANTSAESADLLPYVMNVSTRWRLRYKTVRLPRHLTKTHEILSVREGNIVKLIGQGFSNKEIALRLSIAPETVKSHVKHIFIKLQVKTRAEAVICATRLRLM